MSSQQAMPLGAHVADFQLHISGQFSLDSEVVLSGILRAHVRLEIAKEKDGLECRPIHLTSSRGVEDSVKRIQIRGGAVLAQKRLVKLRLIDKGASAEGRLSAELFQDKLLDRVIEEAPTGANAGLAGVAGTPGDADAGSECLVIGLGHAGRNMGVAGND